MSRTSRANERLADAINKKIARAAEDAGIRSITDDVVTAFSGREACSARDMISSLTMHPNTAGHPAYAPLVATEMPAARSSWRTVGSDRRYRLQDRRATEPRFRKVGRRSATA
jgi:hypothetical protein